MRWFVGQSSKQHWVGLNCAACHTGEISLLRGGLGADATPVNRDLLRTAFGKVIAWENRVEIVNAAALRYGYGRVDAFGQIFNKIAMFLGAAHPSVNPADASFSYPFV